MYTTRQHEIAEIINQQQCQEAHEASERHRTAANSTGIAQVFVASKKSGEGSDKQFEFLMLRDILIYLFLIQMPFAFAWSW